MAFRSLIILAAALLVLARPADANWVPDGVAVASYNCVQVPTSTIADGTGGAYVCWTDDRNCSSARVYLQHLLASGALAPGWPQGGIRVCADENAQSAGYLASDGAQGVIVVWDDSRTLDHAVFAQRFSPDGFPQWTTNGVRVCAHTGSQLSGLPLAVSDGGVFIAWIDRRRGLNDGLPHYHPLYDIYAQRLNADGNFQWAADGVPVDTNGTVSGVRPVVLSDGADGALVRWSSYQGQRFQHLHANGSGAFPGNGTGIAGSFGGVEMADGAGGVICAFANGPDTQEDLYAQRIDSTGTIQWSPATGVLVESANYGQRPNAIAPDGAGGAYIASYDNRNGVDWNIYLTRLQPNGAVSPGWPPKGRGVCLEKGDQIYPTMISDGLGGAVLTWYDSRDTSTLHDIYAQHMLPDAGFCPGWNPSGVRLCGAIGEQAYPVPVPDGTGGAFVVWSDYRGYADVYAQRVSGNGLVGQDPIGVGVTHAIGLSLGQPVPNPVERGAFSLSFALPNTSPATLEIIDVRGRVLVRKIVHASGGMTFGPDVLASLRSGSYLVRLEQQGIAATRKVSIVR